jgi:hypothetical protein
MNDNDKDDRRDRQQRKRSKAQEIRDETLHRRKNPYKRENVNYDYYIQEEALEDEWFEQNN